MKHTASYIDTIHWRISDRAAGALARQTTRRLPAVGRELRVNVPGHGMAWLKRTRYSIRLDAPKRGWVWCVYSPDFRSAPPRSGKFTFVL